MSSVGFHNEFAPEILPLGVAANSNIVPCPISPDTPCNLQVLNVDVDSAKAINPKIFKLIDFCLVGKGEKGANCGGYHQSHVCGNAQCGKLHYAKNRCYRPQCPDCYGGWKMRAVEERIIPRLQSKKAKQVNKRRRLSHVVVSMKGSENVKTVKDFNKMVADAYRFVEGHGLRGGVMIIHGYRATPEGKYLGYKAHKSTWKCIREQLHHEEYMRYSPHFHFVGYYDYMEDGRGLNKNHEINLFMQKVGTEEEKILFKNLKNAGTKKDRELEMKWVYKTILGPGTNSIETFNHNEKGLERLLHYLLSHTVSSNNSLFDSIRWFGNCKKNAFGVTEEEKAAAVKPGMKEEYCKICGAPLISFRRWVRENYYHIMKGDVPEPKYFQEIEDIMGGEGPPEDAKDFVVGDVKEK